MRSYLLGFWLVLAAAPGFSQPAGNSSDENTIRLSDVPKDAPAFRDYPAGPRYLGPPASPDVRSHPRSRLFRTMIREGARQRPNFAGHYIMISWGCGAGCVSFAIVDARTGSVFHPEALRSVDSVNIDYDALEPPEGQLVKFRDDSDLLIVIGGINADPKRRGISYFTWRNNQLKRIRFVPRPYDARR